jgi:hypothetical protein
MRVHSLAAKARHYGSKAYDFARHAGSQLNNFIETSGKLYGGVIQPLLNHHGINTDDADAALMGYYRQYDGIRNAANKFDNLIRV